MKPLSEDQAHQTDVLLPPKNERARSSYFKEPIKDLLHKKQGF
jgi:hypothetical protein